MSHDTDPAATAVALTAAMRRGRARLRQESPPALGDYRDFGRFLDECPVQNRTRSPQASR